MNGAVVIQFNNVPNICNWLHLVSTVTVWSVPLLSDFIYMLYFIYITWWKLNTSYTWRWLKCQQHICLKFRLLNINWKLIFITRSFDHATPPRLRFTVISAVWSSARRCRRRRRLLSARRPTIFEVIFNLICAVLLTKCFAKTLQKCQIQALIGWHFSTKA